MSWLIWVVVVAVSYQAVVALVILLAWRNPRVPHTSTPADLGMAYREVAFPTARSRSLRGWWIPGGEAALPTLILIHGWGRNRERMMPYIEMLRGRRYHLLVFDARHHGLSDEDSFATMKKFSEDIRAAADFLASHPELQAGPLGVIGLSIGGAGAIHAAAHDPRLRALVTVGAFAHPRDAMTAVLPWRPLLAPALPLAYRLMEWRVGVRLDDLAPERHAPRVEGRLLLVHGEEDATVPVSHAHRLAASADERAELWIIPARGHSDPHLEPGFRERVVGFFDRVLASPDV